MNLEDDYEDDIDHEIKRTDLDLDIDRLRNEFHNQLSMENKFLYQQNSLSQAVVLSPVSTSSDLLNESSTIKLNEDDLIDRQEQLKMNFLKEFFDKYECFIDHAQGIFLTKLTKLSKSLQRKLINLNQLLTQTQLNDCSGLLSLFVSNQIADNSNNTSILIKNSIQNQEYKKKLFRLLRSIVERILIDALSLCDQYNNQLQQQEIYLNSNNTTQQSSTSSTTSSSINLNNPTSKLWCEIRNRGCQFLGPQMQDDVLRLILHALETVTRMSRKVLVLYVVHMLKKHYPKASKTSVGHVVQLLYRAGCFKVEKRDNDSSLMELRKEFSKYPTLRRQHDMQIIQIALESGIRMSPEQWSQKLFGDSNHKSEMQSIIDKLQSQQTIEKLINDFYEKIQTVSNNLTSSNDMYLNSLFLKCRPDFEYIASINFEKKQPQLENQLKRSSIVSDESSLNNNGSGGESLASEEEDFSFDNIDLLHYSDETLNDLDFDQKSSNDSSSNKNLSLKSQIQTQQQKEQTKITWSLLNECTKRTINILETHLDYSSKIMPILISNQNNSNSQTSNLKTSLSNQQVQNQKFNGLEINLNSIFLPMGPNSDMNQNFLNNGNIRQIALNQSKNSLITTNTNNNNNNNNNNNINNNNNNVKINSFNNLRQNMSFNVNNNTNNLNRNFLKNKNFNHNNQNDNDFYTSNNHSNNFSSNEFNSKIWSDTSSSTNRNFLDQNNIFQNKLFDSNSFMMMSLQQQDEQQFYTPTSIQARSNLNQNFIKSNLIQQQHYQHNHHHHHHHLPHHQNLNKKF